MALRSQASNAELLFLLKWLLKTGVGSTNKECNNRLTPNWYELVRKGTCCRYTDIVL